MGGECATPACFLLFCEAGLEALVAADARRACGRAGLAGAQLRLDTSPCGDGFVGAVGVSHADAEGLKAALLQLRSCHYIAQRHFVLDVPPAAAAAEGEPELPLRALEQRLEALLPAREVAVPSLEGAKSFRVTGWRTGKARREREARHRQTGMRRRRQCLLRRRCTYCLSGALTPSHIRAQAHAFNSGELAIIVGGCLADQYPACKPKMRGYDVHVRADVVGRRLCVSTQLHEEPLSRRHKAAYLNKVTIKASVAYVMLTQAGLPSDGSGSVMDPFCGSGTILLEALDAGLATVAYGADANTQAVKGTLANAEAAGFAQGVHAERADVAGALYTVPKGTLVDAVVSNPPWGVQTGKGADLKTMYRAFLKTAWQLLKPGGRLVVLVLRGFLFLDVVRAFASASGTFRVVDTVVTKTRNNLPTIVVLEKDEGGDPELRKLRDRLRFLQQYCDMSPSSHKELFTGVGFK